MNLAYRHAEGSFEGELEQAAEQMSSDIISQIQNAWDVTAVGDHRTTSRDARNRSGTCAAPTCAASSPCSTACSRGTVPAGSRRCFATGPLPRSSSPCSPARRRGCPRERDAPARNVAGAGASVPPASAGARPRAWPRTAARALARKRVGTRTRARQSRARKHGAVLDPGHAHPGHRHQRRTRDTHSTGHDRAHALSERRRQLQLSRPASSGLIAAAGAIGSSPRGVGSVEGRGATVAFVAAHAILHCGRGDAADSATFCRPPPACHAGADEKTRTRVAWRGVASAAGFVFARARRTSRGTGCITNIRAFFIRLQKPRRSRAPLEHNAPSDTRDNIYGTDGKLRPKAEAAIGASRVFLEMALRHLKNRFLPTNIVDLQAFISRYLAM